MISPAQLFNLVTKDGRFPPTDHIDQNDQTEESNVEEFVIHNKIRGEIGGHSRLFRDRKWGKEILEKGQLMGKLKKGEENKSNFSFYINKETLIIMRTLAHLDCNGLHVGWGVGHVVHVCRTGRPCHVVL